MKLDQDTLKDIQCELLHPSWAFLQYGLCPNLFGIEGYPGHYGLLNYRCLKCGTLFCSLSCLAFGHSCK